MFKMITVQEAYQRKFQRQREVPEIQFSAGGQCAHIGKLSPGCFWCLSPTALSFGVQVGVDAFLQDVCNLNCTYCFKRIGSQGEYKVPENWKLDESLKEKIRNQLLMAEATAASHEFMSFAFAGDGAEPLLYLPVIRSYMQFYKSELELVLNRKTWYKIYTNGMFANESVLQELRDLGFTEIRFHLGASNFSGVVLRNLRIATKYIPTVTVETPTWPLHRTKLMAVLPVLEDIGVKHLNLIEIGITKWNFESVLQAYPDARIYNSYIGLAMDDDGLVYDIMKEVIKKGYNFSVLDCNTLIRKVRDQISFDGYFREALKKIGFGNDWQNTGYYPE